MVRRTFFRRTLCLTAASFAQGVGSMTAQAETGKGVALVVSLRVKPGRDDAFLRLLAPVLDAMRHESTFINAVLHRDPEDATRFMIYETWADLEELKQVQVHRDYRKAYEARLPEMLAEPRQVQIWQPLRSDFASK